MAAQARVSLAEPQEVEPLPSSAEGCWAMYASPAVASPEVAAEEAPKEARTEEVALEAAHLVERSVATEG